MRSFRLLFDYQQCVVSYAKIYRFARRLVASGCWARSFMAFVCRCQ